MRQRPMFVVSKGSAARRSTSGTQSSRRSLLWFMQTPSRDSRTRNLRQPKRRRTPASSRKRVWTALSSGRRPGPDPPRSRCTPAAGSPIHVHRCAAASRFAAGVTIFLKRCTSAWRCPASSPPAACSVGGSRLPANEAAWPPAHRGRRIRRRTATGPPARRPEAGWGDALSVDPGTRTEPARVDGLRARRAE